MLSELDKTWLACAIDSEGSIQIGENYVRISVWNTNKEFIEKVARLLGTKCKIHTKRLPNRKPQYTAYITKRPKVKKLLQQLLPYFIVKRQVTINALKWIQDNPIPSKSEVAIKTWKSLSAEKREQWLKNIYEGKKKFYPNWRWVK